MKHKKTLLQAVIETMCYSQVFSYALKLSEVHKFLHYNKKTSLKRIEFLIEKNDKYFETYGGYVVLKGEKKFIEKRISKISDNKKKTATAYFISKLLTFIPTVKLIGISGSLSVENANKDHDIDLFIITSKNTLWTTRFLVNILLLVFGLRRGRSVFASKNKICPNMFMEEDFLELPKAMRNIYTAHEIAQLKIIFSKNSMYEKFLFENKWVLSFLPNAFENSGRISVKKSLAKKAFVILITPVERFLFFVQYLHMRKNISREYVSSNLIMFHPFPYAQVIQEIFYLKLDFQKKLMENGDVRREEKNIFIPN